MTNLSTLWQGIARLRREQQRTAWRGLMAGLCGLMLVACGGGEDPGNRLAEVYSTSFDAASARSWLHYPSIDPIECRPLEGRIDPDGTDYAVSAAPWWVDENHAPPGLGYLHLVALAYHRDWSTDGIIPAVSQGARPLDLRNAQINVRWRAPGLKLPHDARLTLWLQTRTSPADALDVRFVNYMLSGQVLETSPAPTRWREDVLYLRADDREYVCLGSSANRADTYGCDITAVDALRDWNTDIGIIIFSPHASFASEVAGAIEIDRLSVHVPAENLETHRSSPPTIVTAGGSTCRST